PRIRIEGPQRSAPAGVGPAGDLECIAEDSWRLDHPTIVGIRDYRKAMISVRRVYESRQPGDGRRVLVDRIWPRGLSKSAADLDEWCKDVAPSTELRAWFGHDPERFAEFQRRYAEELRDPSRAEAVKHLR